MVAIIILPAFMIMKQANNLGLTCPGFLVSNRIISLIVMVSSFPDCGYIHGMVNAVGALVFREYPWIGQIPSHLTTSA